MAARFNIKKHLQQHAHYFKEYEKVNSNDLHFNFSVQDLQFLSQNLDITATMEKILQDIRQPAQYKVKNGFYVDKDDNKKQKYTTRTIDLSKNIKIEAIHIKGSKGEYTQPHIHLVLDKDGRYGKEYSLLKLHISKVLEKYGLVANFDEIMPYNPYAVKNLQSSVKKFFWSLKKLDNEGFKRYIANNKELLKKYLDLLQELTQKTCNLDYYFKTMQTLQNRLNSLKIKVYYNDYNLADKYPIKEVLSKKDIEVIELIQQKKFSQKNIKNYLDNPILRDFVRYSYYKKTKNSYIVTALKKHTTLLQYVKPNKKLVDNYFKLLKEQLPKKQRKSQLTEQDNTFLKFKTAFIRSLKTAKNEKELKKKMEQEGFAFSWKKRKGKTIGIKWEDNYVKFTDLGFKNIAEIRAILANNIKEIKINIEHKNIAEQKEKNRKKVALYRQKQQQRRENERAITANINAIARTIENNRRAIKANTITIENNRGTIESNTNTIDRNRETIEHISDLQAGKRGIIKTIGEFTRIFGEKIAGAGARITRAIGEKIERLGNAISKMIKLQQKKEHLQAKKKKRKSRNFGFDMGF